MKENSLDIATYAAGLEQVPPLYCFKLTSEKFVKFKRETRLVLEPVSHPISFTFCILTFTIKLHSHFLDAAPFNNASMKVR